MEVDRQSQSFAGQLRISEELLFVHRDGLHCLDFHDRLVFHRQIRAKTRLDANLLVVVDDGNRQLARGIRI